MKQTEAATMRVRKSDYELIKSIGKQTGRYPSQVINRLLMALEYPEARALLGEPVEPKERRHDAR